MCGPAHAQRVTWSQSLNDERKFQYLKIIGTDDDGFYLLRSNISFENVRDHSGFRSRKYLLEYFDLDMHLRWSQPLASTASNAKITVVQVFNNKVLVISTAAEKSSHRYRVFAQYMDRKGVYESEGVLLDEIPYEKIDDESRQDLVISQDQSKAVCAFRKIPTGNKDSQEYEAIVVDTSLKMVYKKDITVPLNVKHFTPLDFVLTNEGNFYLVGIKYVTDKKVKAPNESYYQLFSYNYLHDQVNSNEVKIEDKFLTDAGMAADNMNHRIVVAGFYSDKTTYSTAGVFYYSEREDTVGSTMSSSPFSDAFLSRFRGERRENNNKELINYSIDRLILRKDGGAAILAESFFETTSSYWDYYTQTYISHRYYHFGNIIVLSVNTDGSILWGNSVSKDQNSTDDGGYSSSYCSAITGGKIYSIYNKYIEQESSVLMTTVDGTGKQNTDVLFNEVKNISVLPRAAKQIDAETLLLPAYRENRFYIAKIEF